MKRFIPHLGVNPIIVKELRSRMRGPRAFITLTVVLLLTGGIMYAILQIVLAASRYSSVLSPQVGQGMFAALAFLELFMVSTITPAVTAGAISSEKEKQTYEMLMATPLSPSRVLWGKLISAMSYVFLLLFAAVPLASLVFIFGGVAPMDMVKVLLVLLVIAITFGILGLFMSALFGRTGWATVATFITVILLTLGPLFVAILVGVLRESEPPRWLLAPSPISTLSAVLAPALGNNRSSFDIFFALSGIWNMGINPISQNEIPRPLYHYSLPFYFGLSLVLYLLTTRLVQPARRFKLRAREVLIVAGLLLGFCGLLALAYFLSAGRYEWALKDRPIEPTPELMMAVPGIAPAPVLETRVVDVQPDAMQNQLGPTPTPMPPPLPGGVTGEEVPLDLEEQIQVYAAIARQFYTVDHTFGEGEAPNWPVLYLVQNTDDGIGDPDTPKSVSVLIDEKVMSGVQSSLSDLPTDIRWVESSEQVAKDPQSGQVLEDGAVIIFGNIHRQSDGTVHVPASLYFSSLGATGKTYILAPDGAIWTIIGTTGVEWIS